MPDGIADFTQAKDERGLDPIAMLGPIETLYQQKLLPGFSSVTTRLRYYSFHAWWITQYADRVRNTDRKVFQLFTRRCEALYALAAMQANRSEVGLAGAISRICPA